MAVWVVKFTLAAVWFCSLTFLAAGVRLPQTFKVCSRSSANQDNCLRDAIESAIRELKFGLPHLQMPSIDPLSVDQIFINQGTGPVSLSIDFANQKISGLHQTVIQRTRSNTDPRYYSLESDVLIPVLTLEGDYKIGGQILLLPITGNGRSKLTLRDVSATATLLGKPIFKNNIQYIEVTSFIISFNAKHLHMNFGNLFNGNALLGETMNNFMNQNWELILRELKPSIQLAIGAILKEISNTLYLKVPYDNIHPR